MAKRKARQQRRGQPAAPASPADDAGREEAAPGAVAPPADEAAGEPTGSRRRRPSGRQLAGLGAAMLVLVALVAGATVLPSDADSEDREGYLDGVVVVSEEDRLVLRLSEPVDGEDQVEMTIRPRDAEAVDIEHLDYHQVQGDVFRIHYERRGDRYFATLAEDLPGLGH